MARLLSCLALNRTGFDEDGRNQLHKVSWTMENKGKNVGGRAYLVNKLGEHGASRRRAVAIVNKVFEEMGRALRGGEYVEFPFGYLYAYKRLSERWQMIGDEPMRPWWVEHGLDEEGERLLEGERLPSLQPGWSRKPDKNSVVYILDRGRKRSRKAERRSPAKLQASRGSGK
jgi:hypothetical protein